MNQNRMNHITTQSMPMLADALFRPRSIAIFGASGDPKKLTSRPHRYLRQAGYQGRILPINPTRSEVLGDRAYADLSQAEGPVDHAFIMVGYRDVPDAIRQCIAAGVKVATMFSAGFAELGNEGLERQRELVAAARAGGLRLLGPNCLGMINVHDHAPITANAVVQEEKLNPGFLSVVSQSGSMLGTLLTRAQDRQLGFSKLVSVGNEADLSVGEITDLLVDDEPTGAILLFLETFRDANRLAEAARRAFIRGKPVIAYKLGRSAVAQEIASSHTGAMVGSDDVANAFFKDCGIVRVETMEGLIEAAQFLRGHKPPRSRRVSVLTGTGGVAAMVVDRLGVLGCDVVPPPADMRARLAQLDIHISDAALTDIPMGGSDGGRSSAVLSELLASDHSDAVVSVIGSSARTNPKVIIDRVLSATGRDKKPLAVFLGPKADQGLAQLQEHGVAGFRTPESCADVVNAYLTWVPPVDRSVWPAGDMALPFSLAEELPLGALNERQAAALFTAMGVPMVPNAVMTSDSDVPTFAGPYAVKLLSADIPHKTDAGMVRLHVGSGEICGVVKEMLRRAAHDFHSAKVDGVLAQPMVRGLAEVIVGYRHDPEVGPIVLLAMGGITAELKKSRAVRIAPVTEDEARSMIDEIPELAMLTGFRNLPKGDVDALASAIAAVSRFALLSTRTVAEAEINPLIVKEIGNGVIAVDSLVRFA